MLIIILVLIVIALEISMKLRPSSGLVGMKTGDVSMHKASITGYH
jgi:hypothetical protein